jgi:hypothetical protein
MNNRYPRPNAHGTWIVTTEGDEEGRSTRQLGTHTGYLDEIAFKLASQAYYGLQFNPVDPQKIEKIGKSGTKVQVSLGIESGTWDMDAHARVGYFKQMLAGRDVLVEPGQYYACVLLVDGKSPEAQAKAREALLVEQAKSKLEPAELDALRRHFDK